MVVSGNLLQKDPHLGGYPDNVFQRGVYDWFFCGDRVGFLRGLFASFFLVIFNYESEENRKAGYFYLVYSQVGAMFILAAFGVMYAHTGGFGFTEAAALMKRPKYWYSF